MSDIAAIALAAQDEKLTANGFEPVAAVGKVPSAKGWQKRPNTIEAIKAERASHPDATNTGLRTGRLVGIDIDIIDRTHALAIEQIVSAALGETNLRRVGFKGCLPCYRNDTPIPKITIGTDAKRLVEILGTGQQFVAYGNHPDTGNPYEWTNDWMGGEPIQTPLAELPEVTPQQLYEAAHAIAAKLKELGYGDVKVTGIKSADGKPKAPSPAKGKPVTPEIIEAMLRCIPPSIDRNGWLIVCAGLVSAPVTDPAWDGLDLFIRWSRGDLHGGIPPNNFKGEADCLAQWQRDLEKINGK